MSQNLENQSAIGVFASNYTLTMIHLNVLVVTLFTLTILLKNRIILPEVIILKIKRPDKTLFICTVCNTNERIPTKVVLDMDIMDPGDPLCPPMFYCEKCNGLMKPKFFIGHSGIVYTYDDN